MNRELIIVESPTKAKTLSRFFADKYEIIASYGHVRDLPKSKFGIDPENNFTPSYVIPKDKEEIVNNLKDKAEKSSGFILATDPDREGEAIAWHISELLRGNNSKRIVFHEITQEAVSKALARPRSINLDLVDSQQARRVLDRIVGYKLSPILWRKVRKGLSAGRVQSITLKFIVDREREIEQFSPVEFWTIEATLSPKKGKVEFRAQLLSLKDKKLQIKKEKQALDLVSELKEANYLVEKITQKEARKNPYPPFTTSTLVQNASNRFGFSSKKTMKIAQGLYEEGLITYMRTDSLNLASTAVFKARDFIKEKYGAAYLSGKPRVYKTKSKLAQEAHEAIRPANISEDPDKLKKELDRDHFRLYQLIWQRMVACQMSETLLDQTSVDVKAKDYLFRANGSVIKFPGWLKVYQNPESRMTNHEQKEEEENQLPKLQEGELLNLIKLDPAQHFTEPPPRYTEASLIKELEEQGIGRPSTYAPTMSTIQERRYVEKIDRKFQPTPLGAAVCDFLTENFPEEMKADFTVKMEDKLDEVAKGEEKWLVVVSEFYKPFVKHVEEVTDKTARVKIFPELSDEVCELCGKPMFIRYGRYGRFLACSGFPGCRGTKTFEEKVEGSCPECNSQIVQRRSRRGRKFYGCAAYPKCKWMSWSLPEKLKSSENPPESGP